MFTPYTKIGLIQTSPLPGDFSVNLRAIVQGYRECIDHGAQIVLAPADALCGIEPQDLIRRESFIRQMRAAFDALSKELGNVPLLTCGYDTDIDEEELWDGLLGEEEADPATREYRLIPFLVEREGITELDDGEQNDIDGHTVFVCIGDTEMLPDTDACELMVHFGTEPWHSQAAEQDSNSRSWEARTNGGPVACLRSYGVSDTSLYGGGSGLWNAEGKQVLRLPLFETAAGVGDLKHPKPAYAMPEPQQQLRQALVLGIRDSVRHNGYGGVCIPADAPNATLLTALATEALGSGNVCCVRFTGESETAEKLGADTMVLQAGDALLAACKVTGSEDSPALKARVRAMLLQTLADERGLMLLSPLDRSALLTGAYTLYGESCGSLAPLGNLYPYDIYSLSRLLSEEKPDLFGTLTEPEHPELDRILHELADRNVAASDLLSKQELLFRENDVRFMQRKVIAAALRRSQQPRVLQVSPLSERVHLPSCHRMND